MDAHTVEQLKARADHLLHEFDFDRHPKTKFSTSESAHTGDAYFLDSATKISYFLEERAVDDATGKLLCERKEQAVNKIGHYLHALDPVYRAFSIDRPEIKQILRALGYQCPVLLQSMLIFKQAKIGGKVAPHQDSTFLHTDPVSALGFWFPMEDATAENGCLHFMPGSHKTQDGGKVYRRFVRNPRHFQDSQLQQPLPNPPKGERAVHIEYQGSHPEDGKMPAEDDSRFVCVPVPKGSCVLIHGGVVHKSDANTSDKTRFTYAFHAIEGSHSYSKENWLQFPPGKPFEMLYDDRTGMDSVEPKPLPC